MQVLKKNCGMPGLTIVIIREDLLNVEKAYPVPTILHWKKNSDLNSCLNTPPTMAIYIAGLVFKWILNAGGLAEMAKRSHQKSTLLYNIIDQSNGFYQHLVEPGSRSRVNVVFKINPENVQDQFLKEANARGLHGLAGHRLVGGVRVSLYNAVSLSEVECLVAFMKEFQEKHNK